MKTKKINRLMCLFSVMVMACAFNGLLTSCDKPNTHNEIDGPGGGGNPDLGYDFSYGTCKVTNVEIKSLRNVGVETRATTTEPEGDAVIESTHELPIHYWPKGTSQEDVTKVAKKAKATYTGKIKLQFFGYSRPRYAGENIFIGKDPKLVETTEVNTQIWDFNNRRIMASWSEEELPEKVEVTIGEGESAQKLTISSDKLCKNSVGDLRFNKEKAVTENVKDSADFIGTNNKLFFDLYMTDADPQKSFLIETFLWIAKNGQDPNYPDDNIEVVTITELTEQHSCERDTTRNETSLLSTMNWHYATNLLFSDGSRKDSIFSGEDVKTTAELAGINQSLPEKTVKALADYVPQVTLHKVGEAIGKTRTIAIAVNDDPLQFNSSWTTYTAKVGKVEREMSVFGNYVNLVRAADKDYTTEVEKDKKYIYYHAFYSNFSDDKMPQLVYIPRTLNVDASGDFILKILEGKHQLERDTTRTSTQLISTVKGKLELINVWNSGKKDTIYVDRTGVKSYLNYAVSMSPKTVADLDKYSFKDTKSRISDIENGKYSLRLLIDDEDVVFECNADTLKYGDKALAIFPHYNSISLIKEGSYHKDGYYYYRCVASHSIDDKKDQIFFVKRNMTGKPGDEDFVIKYKEGTNHLAVRDTSRTNTQLVSNVTVTLDIIQMWNSGKEDHTTMERRNIMSYLNFVRQLPKKENVDLSKYTFSDAVSRMGTMSANGKYTLNLLVDDENVSFECTADTLMVGDVLMKYHPMYTSVKVTKAGSYFKDGYYYYKCVASHTIADGQDQTFFVRREMTEKQQDEVTGWDYVRDELVRIGDSFLYTVFGIERHSDSSKDKDTKDEHNANLNITNSGAIKVYKTVNIDNEKQTNSTTPVVDGDFTGIRSTYNKAYTVCGVDATFVVSIDKDMSFKKHSLKNPEVTSRTARFEKQGNATQQGAYLVTPYNLVETSVIYGESFTSTLSVDEYIFNLDHTIPGYEVDPDYAGTAMRSRAYNQERNNHNIFDGIVFRKIDTPSTKAIAAFNVDGSLFKLWENVDLNRLTDRVGFIYSNTDPTGFEPANLKSSHTSGFGDNKNHLDGYEWSALSDGRLNTFSPVFISTNPAIAAANPWLANMVKIDNIYYKIGNNNYY